MDNTLFRRDGIVIITATNLTAEDKATIKNSKGRGKGAKTKTR